MPKLTSTGEEWQKINPATSWIIIVNSRTTSAQHMWRAIFSQHCLFLALNRGVIKMSKAIKEISASAK